MEALSLVLVLFLALVSALLSVALLAGCWVVILKPRKKLDRKNVKQKEKRQSNFKRIGSLKKENKLLLRKTLELILKAPTFNLKQSLR